MIAGMKDINWAYVGASLAQSDDNKQAEFFKAFVAECKTWGTTYQVQTQLAEVNNKLSTDEREVLSMLGYDEGLND